MMNRDWFVRNDGQFEAREILDDAVDFSSPYRLYRFLTDVEDIVENIADDYQRLQAIHPLVRRLLISSSWLQGEYLEPDPDTGWAVQMLYDEPDFPLTIQTVTWLPGKVSPIHNHGTWGVVALISGEEKNTFWRCSHDEKLPNFISKTGECILSAGDIICLMPEAIHHVEAIANTPTISFNLYGETNYQQRFEYDPLSCLVKNF
ncbi:cupin [Floridanema aerugineum]|uniref:Cupin n=1 Tax=Floridaenema aerugineum BLCC-F46 TaxID=3153654 RepID=A0ABV4XJ82_9CYAN